MKKVFIPLLLILTILLSSCAGGGQPGSSSVSSSSSTHAASSNVVSSSVAPPVSTTTSPVSVNQTTISSSSNAASSAAQPVFISDSPPFSSEVLYAMQEQVEYIIDMVAWFFGPVPEALETLPSYESINGENYYGYLCVLPLVNGWGYEFGDVIPVDVLQDFSITVFGVDVTQTGGEPDMSEGYDTSYILLDRIGGYATKSISIYAEPSGLIKYEFKLEYHDMIPPFVPDYRGTYVAQFQLTPVNGNIYPHILSCEQIA